VNFREEEEANVKDEVHKKKDEAEINWLIYPWDPKEQK
jgi:hypothetical protein